MRTKRKFSLRSALRRLVLVERQRHLDYARRHVQTVLSFDRYRLQRDRAVEASDQYVRSRADSYCCACSRAAVVTRERSLAQVGSRGKNGPQNYARLQVSDISAELGDRAGVILRVSRLQRIGTL